MSCVCLLGINVELQLDSMKQRGAVRRALFLKSGLPHLTQNVLLRNGGQEQCSEMKIYLKVINLTVLKA